MKTSFFCVKLVSASRLIVGNRPLMGVHSCGLWVKFHMLRVDFQFMWVDFENLRVILNFLWVKFNSLSVNRQGSEVNFDRGLKRSKSCYSHKTSTMLRWSKAENQWGKYNERLSLLCDLHSF